MPQRVATLACINIPHHMAFTEVMATKAADKQQQKMSYVNDSKIEGNELKMFELTLKIMHLPAEETDPYREALSSDEALRAVYNFYRAFKPRRLKPIIMPTLYIWPRKAGNVSQEAAEANAHYVKGPYRFEILEVARNFALQKEPETITRLLLEHLAEHAQ
ncbi:MAG: alpha/beta fold hydrolase [Promethearchaeota archaeon]